MSDSKPHYLITPAGSFRIKTQRDGSIKVDVPESATPFISPLLLSGLLDKMPAGWTVSYWPNHIHLQPPEERDDPESHGPE